MFVELLGLVGFDGRIFGERVRGIDVEKDRSLIGSGLLVARRLERIAAQVDREESRYVDERRKREHPHVSPRNVGEGLVIDAGERESELVRGNPKQGPFLHRGVMTTGTGRSSIRSNVNRVWATCHDEEGRDGAPFT
jgi:hypothetical protein